MELSNLSLRGILAGILSVDEKYVILKQGNWFNPQSMLPTDEKPSTWIAFKIASNKPVTLPSFEEIEKVVDEETTNINVVRVDKIAEIDLQFVGTKAEELANNVSTWIMREDVRSQLATVNGLLMADDMNVRTVDFYQDGANNILSYNVHIRVAWVSYTETTQQIVENMEITGGTINA